MSATPPRQHPTMMPICPEVRPFEELVAGGVLGVVGDAGEGGSVGAAPSPSVTVFVVVESAYVIVWVMTCRMTRCGCTPAVAVIGCNISDSHGIAPMECSPFVLRFPQET